jgi:SAM-dependent methyltransferase
MIISKLKWVSSVKKENFEELEKLDKKLMHFYSSLSGRDNYQKMIDSTHTNESNFVSKIADVFTDYIMSLNFKNVIEFGCGSGKVYSKLKTKGFEGHYTGYEMAEYVIAENKVNMKEAQWITGSIYDSTITSSYYDCAFSFFVLEHLVYPEKALHNMLRVIKPGGSIFLLFPDMVESLVFTSQKIGINKLSGVKNKLKSLKFFDAIITYFETKSFRNHLKQVNSRYGDFVINLDPICFEKNTIKTLIPDMDAVYIANAKEIISWAAKFNCEIIFPFGRDGQFRTTPLIQIVKS